MSFIQKIAALGTQTLGLLVMVLFAGLAILNSIWTADFPCVSDTYVIWERAVIGRTSAALFLLNAAAALALAVLLRRALCRVPRRVLMAALTVLPAGASFGWSLYCGAVPRADSKAISDIAGWFLQGNFAELDYAGGYLIMHPHQLGIIAVTELLYRIGGAGNYRLFYFFNALAMAWCFYELCRLGDSLSDRRQAEARGRATAFLLFGAWAAMLYCVFLYGNVIGMALATAALRRELLWLEGGRNRHLAATAVFITLAVLVKKFSLIYLAAMVIVLVLEALRGRRLRPVAAALLLVACWLVGSRMLIWGYEQRSGRQIPDGAPMILFVAMGAQESGRGPGWWSPYEMDTFQASNCDPGIAARAAWHSIAGRMQWFVDNPDKGVSFYLRKTITQWAEPTHQCLWLSYKLQDAERPPLLQDIYIGLAGDIAVGWMGWYHLLVFAAAAYFLALRRWRLSAPQLLPGLVVFGGFLFQLIWEAKSQYTLCYFLLAIPYAAAGLSDLTGRLARSYGAGRH